MALTPETISGQAIVRFIIFCGIINHNWYNSEFIDRFVGLAKSKTNQNKLANIPHTGLILLAAGSSKRLGQNKLLYSFKGKSLLERTLQSAVQSHAQKIAMVTGSYNIPKEANKEDILITKNENWETGIGSSIKCGLQLLLDNTPSLDFVIVSVCDQPYLNSTIYNALIKEAKESGKPIVASKYRKSLGVPVLYHKSYFSSLLELQNDTGAKKQIFESNKEDLTTIPFPNGDIDIDTLDDIKQFEKNLI